jgi:hypothetical protein
MMLASGMLIKYLQHICCSVTDQVGYLQFGATARPACPKLGYVSLLVHAHDQLLTTIIIAVHTASKSPLKVLSGRLPPMVGRLVLA